MASIKRTKTKAGESRYRVRWRAEGRLVERWAPTLKTARAIKTKAEADALDGIALDPRRGTQKLNDYFDAWLPARLVKGKPLAASTAIGYKRLWKRAIRESIGKGQFRAIRPDSVRAWHGKLTIDASADQAAKAYTLLRAVLATAEADDLIAASPCRIRGGGQQNPAERPIVATQVVKDLAESIDRRYRAMVLIAGYAGLRTGESLGLRRCDIDLLHGEIHVSRQAQEVGGRIVIPPKSEAGVRVVACPSAVVKALEAHLAEFVDSAEDAPLFTEASGKPARRATISVAWRAAVQATEGAPKGLRPHDLRHHAATLAARTPGVSTKQLMARIGHASPRAALIYQHATADRDRAIAQALETAEIKVESDRMAPVVDLDAAACGAAVGLADGEPTTEDSAQAS